MAAPRVAVCVATCRRAEGLSRLLDCIAAQRFPGGTAPALLAVVVVDNDPDATAAGVVEARRAAGYPWPLVYAHEPTRGISYARNRALALTEDGFDLIAFVDDDEEPPAAWLDGLLAAWRRTGADVVAGPVRPIFEGPAPPAWIRDGGFFETECPPLVGGAVDRAYTNNVLVRRDAIKAAGARFDERLALVGGEDIFFFSSLFDAGCRIVWSDEAVVYERVPASRARLGWLVRRWSRIGGTDAALFVHRRRGRFGRLIGLGMGCARVVLGGAALVAVAPAAPFAGARVAGRLRTVCRGLGMIAGMLGWLHQEYKRA